MLGVDPRKTRPTTAITSTRTQQVWKESHHQVWEQSSVFALLDCKTLVRRLDVVPPCVGHLLILELLRWSAVFAFSVITWTTNFGASESQSLHCMSCNASYSPSGVPWTNYDSRKFSKQKVLSEFYFLLNFCKKSNSQLGNNCTFQPLEPLECSAGWKVPNVPTLRK